TLTIGATVDIGTHHFALWSPQVVPAGASLILAQTATENFDGSDTNPAGCFNCDPSTCTKLVSHTVPEVHLTVNGVTTTYSDPGQVLNTNGVDASGCPATGTRNDESHPWVLLPAGVAAAAQDVTWSGPAPAFETHGMMGMPVPDPARGGLT